MSFDNGLWLPYGSPKLLSSGSLATLDATGELVACVGRIAIEGKATSKTLDTTGSSSIKFSVSVNPVFDNASSVFTVGFQGVDKTTGFPVRNNGSWGARAIITTAANTTPALTDTSSFHTIVPTAGTTTLSHGDEVCFVMEMTTRAGSDSVLPVGGNAISGAAPQYPSSVTNVSGSYAASQLIPNIEITFSDGTLGTIDGSVAMASSALIWNDSNNPDEYAVIFQPPWGCTIDAIAFPMRLVDGTSDLQFDITSDPEGTPASLISGPIALTAENLTVAVAENFIFYSFASDISLSANTDYCLSVKATGAGNIRWTQATLPSAGYRVFAGPSGATIRGATRNGGSGAFGGSSTTTLNPISVRVSGITAGGAGGGMRLAGHGGLAA